MQTKNIEVSGPAPLEGQTNLEIDENWPTLTMNNLRTFGCHTVVKDAKVIIDNCIFEETMFRCMDINGGDIQNSYFGNVTNKSIFTLTNEAGEEYLIRNNFFNLPATIHGQICAAYYGSWQNVTIDHNIFYNCRQQLSYQPSGANSGVPENNGTYQVSNNLFYIDYIATLPIKAGQTGLAFNGSRDDIGTATSPGSLGDQKVYYLNNTSWMNTGYENVEMNANNNVVQTMQWTLNKHYASDVRILNNIVRSIRHSGAEGSSDWTNATAELGQAPLKHVSMYNAVYGQNLNDESNSGYGQNDLPDPPLISGTSVADPSGIFNETTLEPEGTWANSASDGNQLGIRWAQIPTVAQLSALNSNYGKNPDGSDWSSVYSALSIPSPTSVTPVADDRVQATDDFRS